ncbi:MAG: sigma 54-interacting transcriptional regulator [Deltaproteobacteria bacterium]|nr:sigma 54-interacting transcriptional regulator [Deltaproteobacteria bacterium]
MAAGGDTTVDPNTRSVHAPAARPGVIAIHCVAQPLLRVIDLVDCRATLGRLLGEDVPVDGLVSRRHADVHHARGRWTVTDHGSRNGSVLDGRTVTGTAVVDGDAVLRLGYTVFLLCGDVRRFEGAAVAVGDDGVIGPTLAMALAEVARAAAAPCVLLGGESGAGKELAARTYHRTGPAPDGPFLAINCAAIPEGVAERLLFGAQKGAYSGATTDADGYVASADGGTLFLDEVAELDPAVQAKLLRVIETGEVLPLGAARPRRVSTRFCFATYRNLRAAVRDGGFRADLYYRIAKDEVRVPSLRERREELPWLLAWALAPDGLTPHARLVEACALRSWPGNVRELLASVRRAGARARAAGEVVVRETDLDPQAGMAEPPPVDDVPPVAPPRELTAATVQEAIAAHGGNLAAVARVLGMPRPSLYRLLKRLGIETRGE